MFCSEKQNIINVLLSMIMETFFGLIIELKSLKFIKYVVLLVVLGSFLVHEWAKRAYNAQKRAKKFPKNEKRF